MKKLNEVELAALISDVNNSPDLPKGKSGYGLGIRRKIAALEKRKFTKCFNRDFDKAVKLIERAKLFKKLAGEQNG